jgi:hypothetical protein
MFDSSFEVFRFDSPVSRATLVGHFHPPKASPEKSYVWNHSKAVTLPSPFSRRRSCEINPVGEKNFLHGYTASLALFVKKQP